MKMLVMGHQPACGDAFEWTDEDQAVLRFRFEKQHRGNEKAIEAMATAICMDFIDAEYLTRAVKCCDTLREFDRMMTDWLIEQAEAHIKACDADHISEIFKKITLTFKRRPG